MAPTSTRATVRLDGLAHGGDAVGRLPDGKACFVAYGIPGETVVVDITEERKRFARGTVVDVVEASPHRVPAPCPHFGAGQCGGCRLQHIDPAHQADLLRQVVTDQLERIGKLADPPVAPTVRPHGGDGLGYRITSRMAPDADGRLGFRRAGSHDIKPIDMCPLLEPATAATRAAAGDDWRGVEEVVIRADANGRGTLEIHPGSEGLPSLPPGDVAAVVINSARPVPLRGDPILTERVGGRTFQVSPSSFFQSSRAGAEALVHLVREAAAVESGDTVLDLYAGVGLFSAFLAADGGAVTAVETGKSEAQDAAANVADLDVEVLQGRAEHVVEDLVAEHRRADVVVVDPPRRGIGEEMARRVSQLTRRRIVYVSCDPASLARDAGVLTQAGWRLATAVPVDQFTHTAHVEIVASFDAPGPPSGYATP